MLDQLVMVTALAWTTLTAGVLLLSFLPGGVEDDAVAASSSVGSSPHRTIPQAPAPSRQAPPSPRLVIAGALILLIVAAAVRLPGLGYAEFHGDEARTVLRAAAVIQGDDSALLIHRKGPVEILGQPPSWH